MAIDLTLQCSEMEKVEWEHLAPSRQQKFLNDFFREFLIEDFEEIQLKITMQMVTNTTN